MTQPYDSVLLVSFGGPEGPDEVLPFLENVLRGRNVPRERLLEVAGHYHHFGGVSPINEQNRQLIDALHHELRQHGPDLPIYWGNRNWHPLLADTLRQMAADGRQRALGLVTAAFSCYSGCRQYREDIERARAAVGETAPEVDKLRVFFNHPGFITAQAQRVSEAVRRLPDEWHSAAPLVFTAHSIPLSMAEGSNYVAQLQEASRLVAEMVGREAWQLVYQSRSGSPQQPWLEPDIVTHLRNLHAQGFRALVIVPIGFVSDHMEVLYDLDIEARQACDELGLVMERAGTVGTHPAFTRCLQQLIAERVHPDSERLAWGRLGPSHDVCPLDCCPSGRPSAVPNEPHAAPHQGR